MRRLLAALAFLSFGFLATAPVSAQEPQQANPALWRVETGKAPLWLFGSFHLLPPGTLWRTEEFNAAFAAAEVAVFEIPTDPTSQAEIQELVIARGLNPSGTLLSEIVSPETWIEVSAFSKGLGIEPGMIEPMRPWYVALLLTVQHMIALGFDPSQGVDVKLAPEAEALGKTLTYLETPAQQIAIFADLPEKLQEELLIESVRELKATSTLADDMAKAWLSGDTATLAAMVHGSLEKFPELQERLMLARNRAWVEKIEALARDGRSAIIVVGAGHLVGRGSLVELLRARGAAIEGP